VQLLGLLEKHGLSRQAIREKTGISTAMMSMIMTHKRPPSVRSMLLISEALAHYKVPKSEVNLVDAFDPYYMAKLRRPA